LNFQEKSINKLLIVDDHSIVRKGMIQIFEADEKTFEIGEAENGSEAMQKIREEHWDMVLLDIALPGKRGSEVLTQIKQERPKLPVLILSSYPEDQYAVRLIRSGAVGYLNKQSAPEQLIEAIKTVAEGKKYINTKVANLLAESLADPKGNDQNQVPHAKLSDREFHVFMELALGKPLINISDELCVSIKTVSTYRTRLLEKMKMKSNAEITLYAIRNQLIE